MLLEFVLSTAEDIDEEGVPPFMVATTPGNAGFLFPFFGFKYGAEVIGCNNPIVTTAMPNAGITCDDLDSFNGADVMFIAVKMPAQQIVLFGRNIIELGGHSRKHFNRIDYLLLTDVFLFNDNITSAALAGFTKGREESSKIESCEKAASQTATTVFGFKILQPDV